jgi:hypothetical protein
LERATFVWPRHRECAAQAKRGADHDVDTTSRPDALFPAPADDDVLERFGIDILRTPGGLVLKGGDSARTKRGDLMLNHADDSAMFRLVQGWRYNPR